MSKWLVRLIVGLLVFNIIQFIAWGILAYPSMTAWKKSIEWIVFMSWYANQVGSIAALGTSLIMLIQLRQDREGK